ncbi:MAG: EamA family transporter [Gammaproteobacteria bacterium]|nr:EamA family transporter [Gammaproteobacteria bacterium]MDE2250944.1 EamA family transporter [Gammaproteobacteria bacterium]
MSDLFLYVVTVLIWGSTWFAITLQLGVVPPAVSVAWRFLAAAAILIGFALLRGLPLRFGRRDHLWMALQGLLLFCLNYVGFYVSEQYLASGLVAVICSMLTVGNIIGMRVFFDVHTQLVNLLGALLGIIGVVVLFWPEMHALSVTSGTTAGIAWALGATISASLGNMVATRNQRHALPVLQVNGWSMLYGALITSLIALATGQRFVFDWSWRYLGALAYLAVFGSVLAFGAYLTLMKRIGAGRAGYSMVAIPVVALLISTFLEGLQWTATLWAGVALCLAGNVLVLRRDPAR